MSRVLCLAVTWLVLPLAVTWLVLPLDLVGAVPGSDLTGAVPGSDLAGAAPCSDLAGAAPCSDLAGAVPGSDLAGAVPGSDLAGAVPGSDLAGAVPGSDLAGAVPGGEPVCLCTPYECVPGAVCGAALRYPRSRTPLGCCFLVNVPGYCPSRASRWRPDHYSLWMALLDSPPVQLCWPPLLLSVQSEKHHR